MYDLQWSFALMHVRLCAMDGRRREVKDARQAFRQLTEAVERELNIDRKRNVLFGPADIAKVRAALEDKR